MADQIPTIQHSETDGPGPAKRRRRPALSCVECRMRKVRCDREKPCRACTRIKSPTCTYRPPPRRAGRSKSPAIGSSSATLVEESASPRSSHDLDHGNVTEASQQMHQFDTMINRYVAPGIFGIHGKENMGPLPDRRFGNSGHDTTSSAASTVHGLVDQVKELQLKLAAAEERISPGSSAPLHGTGDEEAAGSFVKSKFFGESHWLNSVEPYEALGSKNIVFNERTNRTMLNKHSDLYFTVDECKRLARTIKSARVDQRPLPPQVYSTIPCKETCDQLLDCYLRTFEGIFRVLHIPSFLAEYESYWNNDGPGKPSVLLKILLVCAIGVPFYAGDDQARLRASSTEWIHAAESWLSAPHDKSRLNAAGLQIHILLLIARQVCQVDGDLIWIPAGSLLRSAMYLGLHRDPARFGKKISVFHAEMRRRLWATVLELTVQSSLDMGMPPMISPQDYDTLPPSNLNDDEIGEGVSEVESRPHTEFTQTSIQIAFSETLPLRLEITQLINNLRFHLSYDDALRLGEKLSSICRKKTAFLQTFMQTDPSTNPFQIKMYDTLVRRFVLCLHRPFFAKAKDDPKYYYSRKICLETSLTIAAPAQEVSPGETDDWTSLTYRCVGFWKSFFLYAISTVYLELVLQIEEQRDSTTRFTLTPLTTTSRPSSTTPTRPQSIPPPPQFATLRGVLASAYEIVVARIRNGETNAKGTVFLACALARIDALVSGEDPDLAVLNAARTSVRETAIMMRDAYRAEHGKDIDVLPFNEPSSRAPPPPPPPTNDTNYADCMAGANTTYTTAPSTATLQVPDITSMPHHSYPTPEMTSTPYPSVPVPNDDAPRMDFAAGAAPTVDAPPPPVVQGYVPVDWDVLMQEDSMDFGFGFNGSPESWFGGGWEGVGGFGGGFGMPGGMGEVVGAGMGQDDYDR